MTALEDDVIVVTGASRGLGRAMAERFAEEGARVVLTARDGEQLDAVAADLPGESLVVPADVRDSDDVERVIDRTLERFGRLDTLVNNAGVSLLHKADHDELSDITEDEWDRVLEVNLKGVFLFTRAAVPHLYEQGHGTIINISSGLGRRAIPGAAAYVSSKWGLEGLTRATALESEPYGVTVNGLDPGGRVNTDIWAHLPAAEREEILQPDVMNDAAVLLAAQGPDGVTGESMAAEEWEQRLG
ncbi:SDR family NAD(P)-dependent oxidoreductase [Natronorubrum bangense]|uniref:Short-chain dehydrogenase/reductase SDR n=2 Tax=Natronorubrum bangense TaxID=61858 RepID=L9WQM7_9EURY|nr:SDR family oxidoreductase [Natronorubrum bangense]ELY51486.1 short-chain dehydrogenase/reductase SDR [Natronorubrum bangense JCM 10635]QCC54552.1 SDR family oxidoreductase [Natronorubrum bangense]